MNFIVPSGIGDFSWIWSKLCSVRSEVDKFIIPDGWPHRTAPYVELCGIPAEYGPFNYEQILADERVKGWSTWKDIRKLNTQTLMIEANRHLEAGKPLHEWLPDLETNHHYPLMIRQQAKQMVDKLLVGIPRPLVGISCASYRGSEAWQTWGRDQWVEFLKGIMNFGWQPILLGGFWDDLSHHVAQTLDLPDLVGKTSVEEMVVVQSELDAYIGFSSGLGMIRMVQGKPCMMMWPQHQEKLSRSWIDPEMSSVYFSPLWTDVSKISSIARNYLELEACSGLRNEEEETKEAAQA